jgi:hypothetical protein
MAASASRIIKNVDRQSSDLTEVMSGITKLRARGLSDAAIQALGIDSVEDVKQVRKLLRSSDSDLKRITSGLSKRDDLALKLAASEQQAEQRKTITQAIIDAAKTLGINKTPAQAAQIANTFNLTGTMNPDQVALAILKVLSGGRIG